MNKITLVNTIIALIFTLSYCYQFVYIPISIFKKEKPHRSAPKPHRYAVLIAARNEAPVIAQLIESLKHQTYPAELVSIFVIADNCTDNTAELARACGAEVIERFNTVQIGKGYALDCLLQHIQSTYGSDAFDGFFVFDADNVVEPNYIEEMNHTFSDGYRIVTSFRNSKNYGDSWISAGTSMWFLRDSQFLNRARMRIGSSCIVSGTGFLVHRDVLLEAGGWKYFLITEDTQFTVCQILKGEKIGYCEHAVFYDEQPVKFAASWKQRMRWARGGWLVFREYGARLLRSMTHQFSSFDMFMSFFPAMILSALALVWNVVCIVLTFIEGRDAAELALSVGKLLGSTYLLFFVVGLIATVSEWKHIYCATRKKILYMFTFPLFMMTYIPMPLFAIFKKVEWKPIPHERVRSLSDVRTDK